MEFYEKNYEEFSKTRYSIWDSVKKFSESFKKDSLVLDAGCGNGKNMNYLKDKCEIIGIDSCKNFVTLCKERQLNVLESNILNLPFEDSTFDYIISIAVIHHLKTESERYKAIDEMLRVLKPNGKILVTVWAYESDKFSENKKFKIGDNIVKFNNNNRYYYIFNKEKLIKFLSKYNSNIYWDKGNWNVEIRYHQY